jgi:hypothetical protein
MSYQSTGVVYEVSGNPEDDTGAPGHRMERHYSVEDPG